MRKSKYGELASNTLIFACATLGSKIVMFLLLPLYTNVLSTSQYGTVELIVSTINLLTPILTLSITDALLRFGLDKNISHDKVLKATLRFLFFVSLISALCAPLVELYPPLKGYSFIFGATLITFIFRSTVTFYLKSIDKNLMFAIDTILYTLLLAGLNILFLVVMNLGVLGYMLSLIVASAASIVFCAIVGKIPKALGASKFDKQLLKQMLLYSCPLILNALSWFVTHSSDKYMLEYFISTSAVGIYSAASKIPALLNTVNSLFSQAWTISSVKEYDSTADKSFFENIFAMFAMTMILATAVILMIVKPFMDVYVGKTFSESWIYVPALLIAALFGSLSGFFGSIYVATRKNIRCTISTVICCVTNVILNALLIPRVGIMGAAIATAVSYIVVGVYRMLDCQKVFHFHIHYLKHGLASLFLLIEAYCVTTSKHYLYFSAGALIAICLIYARDMKKYAGHMKAAILRRKVNA